MLRLALQPGMWKRKRWTRQAFVGAEAGSGKRIPLPLWPFISNFKNLNVVEFFVKYTTKSKCFIDHHLQRNILKICGSLRPGTASPLST